MTEVEERLEFLADAERETLRHAAAVLDRIEGVIRNDGGILFDSNDSVLRRLRSRRAKKLRVIAGDLDLAEERLAMGLKQAPREPHYIGAQGMLYARRNQRELPCSAYEKP